MTQTLRVAISGGGLAGACLIHALLEHPHIDAYIFESALAFQERGVAVGIARNALAALDLIGPSAAESLKRAGAVAQQGVLFKLGDGPDQGSLVAEANALTEGRRLTSIVQRADFLRELLADVPSDRMQAGKKLTNVEGLNTTGPITLNFADGTTHECDILVGADGIHSRVRELVIGENDAVSCPRNTGSWVVMTLQPYEKAQAALGPDLVQKDDAREYSWLAFNQIAMHNVLSDGKLVQMVIGSHDPKAEGSDQWQRTVSADEMKGFFKNGPSFLNKAVKEGSGAGMSIEDSLVLSSLLGKASNPVQARVALKIYDQVWRPRTQRIVESSRETGDIVMGRGERGLELQWMRENLVPR